NLGCWSCSPPSRMSMHERKLGLKSLCKSLPADAVPEAFATNEPPTDKNVFGVRTFPKYFGVRTFPKYSVGRLCSIRRQAAPTNPPLSSPGFRQRGGVSGIWARATGLAIDGAASR